MIEIIISFILGTLIGVVITSLIVIGKRDE